MTVKTNTTTVNPLNHSDPISCTSETTQGNQHETESFNPASGISGPVQPMKDQRQGRASTTHPQATGASQDPIDSGMDLLRFSTAGSVDDGKSTLIGRLLFDSKSIFEDQLVSLEQAAQSRGENVNLALLTDGLRAERAQGITIDVAYRYFATPRRKFIIADTPGHEQYTRNMVTGASTADLAIILIDARKGVLTQSRRHAFISSLLGIPRLVLAVNKMDLVDYSHDRFVEIVKDFSAFAHKISAKSVVSIPVSALRGDNIVNSSVHMPWYDGPTLLRYLEEVEVGGRRNTDDFRFPVQYVIRPNQNYRGFAGRVVSGRIGIGEQITLLPSNQKTMVKALDSPDGPIEQAMAGDSVTIRIRDEMDVSRGDMIVGRQAMTGTTQFEATLCWMNTVPLILGQPYIMMHTTNEVSAVVRHVEYRTDMDSLSQQAASTLTMNEIGRVHVETARPVFLDTYKQNNATGSFILVDPGTNGTVAGGLVQATSTSSLASRLRTVAQQKSPHVTWESWNIPRKEREARNAHEARVIWLTGVSGAGKTTIGRALEKRLWAAGKQTLLLDGDQLRHGLNGDLGFSPEDRAENIRRSAEVARLCFEHGLVVICCFVSPARADRQKARVLFPEGSFTEVFLHCDLQTREKRDPKGLYQKAREGKISSLTGYDAHYEASEQEVLSIKTDHMEVDKAVDLIVRSVFGIQ